jgi:hypothetical protein
LAKSSLDRNLTKLEAELKRLEAEYNMYFSGRLHKPPWETRTRVTAMVKEYDRTHIRNYGDRFRFQMLQSRFQTFVDLWDRGLRAREEGRAGPFSHPRPADPAKKEPGDRVMHVATIRDPAHEAEKLTELYKSLTQARLEAGQEQIPFHKFAEVVKGQVQKLRDSGSPEVAFRVSVKNGKVNFTARALKKPKE